MIDRLNKTQTREQPPCDGCKKMSLRSAWDSNIHLLIMNSWFLTENSTKNPVGQEQKLFACPLVWNSASIGSNAFLWDTSLLKVKWGGSLKHWELIEAFKNYKADHYKQTGKIPTLSALVGITGNNGYYTAAKSSPVFMFEQCSRDVILLFHCTTATDIQGHFFGAILGGFWLEAYYKEKKRHSNHTEYSIAIPCAVSIT